MRDSHPEDWTALLVDILFGVSGRVNALRPPTTYSLKEGAVKVLRRRMLRATACFSKASSTPMLQETPQKHIVGMLQAQTLLFVPLQEQSLRHVGRIMLVKRILAPSTADIGKGEKNLVPTAAQAQELVQRD